MIENEYRHNARFRAYVDGYCREHGCSVGQALGQDEVKQAFWYYTEV